MNQIKPELTEIKLENEETWQPQLWVQGVPEVKAETEEIKVEPLDEVKEEDEQKILQPPTFGTSSPVFSGINVNVCDLYNASVLGLTRFLCYREISGALITLKGQSTITKTSKQLQRYEISTIKGVD